MRRRYRGARCARSRSNARAGPARRSGARPGASAPAGRCADRRRRASALRRLLNFYALWASLSNRAGRCHKGDPPSVGPLMESQSHFMNSSDPAHSLVTPSATMPLESAALRVVARGGVARVILEQTFANHHPDPLAVTYVLPLPADGAVSGFAFTIGDRRIEGEIDRKRAARERYEDAIAHGHTAALLEQERSSLFTQEIGNVPPGARVVCEIVIDQPLRWLDEGSWEWRFPLAAAPRYLGEPGRVSDAAKVA